MESKDELVEESCGVITELRVAVSGVNFGVEVGAGQGKEGFVNIFQTTIE